MRLLTVFINPACSKCRRALEILGERGATFDAVEYLKNPPDRATLERVLRLLGTPPTALVRRDKRFVELGLDDAACASTEQVVNLLLAHPELMERPVVVCGERALIARPPERVLELLD